MAVGGICICQLLTVGYERTSRDTVNSKPDTKAQRIESVSTQSAVTMRRPIKAWEFPRKETTAAEGFEK